MRNAAAPPWPKIMRTCAFFFFFFFSGAFGGSGDGGVEVGGGDWFSWFGLHPALFQLRGFHSALVIPS